MSRTSGSSKWSRALLGALSLFLISTSTIAIPASAQEVSAPTIRSEFPDYAPGDQVKLIGEGWEGGEVVNVYVDDSLERAWTHNSAPDDPVADAGGYFEYFFTLSDNFVATYTVIATGSSGATATTTFTDTPIDSNFGFDQWETDASPQWITGNLGSTNSTYEEGQAVPFRLQIPNNTPISDNPVEFSICRDYSNGTKRGYLFLEPFDTDYAADPGGTINSTSGPLDGVNVTINSVNEVGGQGGCGAGQRETQVSVNINASTPRYVLWGGHLAQASDVKPNEGGAIVGGGNSAGFYPGSSLSMRIKDSAKNRSINPGAIIEIPFITAKKVVDPPGEATPDQWCFNIAPNPNGETLPKCPATGGDSVQFLDLPNGNYQITETGIAGYEFVLGEGTNCPFGGTSTGTATVASGTTATNATCIFHNAPVVPDNGSIQVVKDLVPSDDLGTFNLFIDDENGDPVGLGATGVGDGGTTAVESVPPGTYTVGETAATGTSLSDYSRSISCKDAADVVVASNADGADLDVVIDSNDVITCTITNSRNTGSLTVVKDFSENSPAEAVVDLQIDGETVLEDAGDTDSFTKTVNTGNHSVGEIAVDGTPLSDYSTSISCDTDPVTENSGSLSLASIAVASGDDITCTITNSRNTGSLTVVKDFSENSPAEAVVDLQIDGETVLEDAGDTDSFTKTVNTGNHSVGEIAVDGTPLSDYSTSISCDTDPVTENSGSLSLASIAVASGDDITCTITNSRNTGSLTVVKDFSENSPAEAVVDLQIDGETVLEDAGDTDSFTKTVNTGNHSVGEIAVDGTPLSDYSTSISCDTDPVTENSGSLSLASIAVASGDDITCTITNSRNTGSLTVVKDFSENSPAEAVVDLQIDGETVLEDAGDTDSFTKTVNTGNHSVGEIAVDGTPLSDYSTSISCDTDPVTENSGSLSLASIAVASGDDITCTITNSRNTGSLTVVKDFSENSPAEAVVDLQIDGETVLEDAGDTDSFTKTVNTGNHSVGEIAVDGTPLSDYSTSISCDTDPVTENSGSLSLASIAVASGDDITCTITNSRNTGSLTVVKDFSENSPAEAVVDLQIDGETVLEDAGDTDSFTKTVNTGNHSVGEIAVDGTPLSDYSTSISCDTDPVTENSGSLSLASIAVASGDDITCTITNSRNTGSLTIEKVLDRGGSSFNTSTDFTISYECKIGSVVTKSGSVQLAGGENTTITGVPTGSICTVTEPSQPAPPTGYFWTVTITGSPTAAISTDAIPTVTVTNKLNANSGALTIGFWQNKNGQGIIKSYCGTSSTNTTNLVNFLRTYAPFQDLSPSAACANANGSAKPDLDDVQSYAFDVIKAATCTTSSKTCNSMLKAQMLATALNVYFSDPALGGKQIGQFNGLGANQQPIGAMTVDLSTVCTMIDGSGGAATCSGTYALAKVQSVLGAGGTPSSPGIATSETRLTVSTILTRVAAYSSAGGGTWYNQKKASQVIAKDVFDSINNQAVKFV